jgi:hypothetical protein
MQSNKLKLLEYVNRVNELAGVNPVAGKHLIVVDIQPEYTQWCKHILLPFINFLNQNYESLSQLTFLYNGESLGMISENDYCYWWIEMGLDEDIVFDSYKFDKGYAFFRYCMDEGIDEDVISQLIKYMIEKGVNETRDLDEDFWNEYVERFGSEDVRELLEFAGDCIHIPDLMDELKGYNNIVLCGGGINECLKEVEIALKALDKEYNVLTKFTY